MSSRYTGDKIVVRVRSFDDSVEKQERSFATIEPARQYAQRFLGPHPAHVWKDEDGWWQAVDYLNSVGIQVRGATDRDLFPRRLEPLTQDSSLIEIDMRGLLPGERIYKASRTYFDKQGGVPERWVAERVEGGKTTSDVFDSPREAKVAIVSWRRG